MIDTTSAVPILPADGAALPGGEGSLEAYQRERTAFAGALAALRSDGPLDAIAAALCRALVTLGGFRAAGMLAFEVDGRLEPLAVVNERGEQVAAPAPVPLGRAVELRALAAHGPWIEERETRPDGPWRAADRVNPGAGGTIEPVAYGPVRTEDDTVALLVALGRGGGRADLARRLPALAECAAFAGALLGPRLRTLTARALGRERIARIIRDRTFVPVFQPIVELGSGATVGYEALTRFVDGRRPDVVFAEAAGCGMSLELEAATLAAVVEAAASLPPGAWLNLNVSAELVLERETLLATLARVERKVVVLELTEHAEINDYAAVRRAVEEFGPRARLAVDDAGAGFASLRHVLELRPDYIKLDRALVHLVHRDVARQALVAGLGQFASRMGSTLIAEGIESRAEAVQLQALGVPLAQGYWLGRPALVSRIANPMIVAPPTTRARAADRPRGAAVRTGDDVDRAVNIGSALGSALREVGVPTVSELRRQGAMTVWERLRRARPAMATGTTLLHLEGAARGVRVTQIPPAERARLRLQARLGHSAA